MRWSWLASWVFLRWLVALGLPVVLGCANRESRQTFRTQDPPPFSQAGEVPVAQRWWTAFADPGLDQQINAALRGSFTLSAARQRLYAARAIARREASNLFPDLDGVVDVGYRFGPGPDVQSYIWGWEASYPVDLWGQIESRVDAERLRAAAQREQLRAFGLTLSAEIASVWFSLIEAKAQLDLLGQQVETNTTGLERQRSGYESGTIRAADVLRQQQLLEATLEQESLAKARIEVLEHQLAVLVGSMPQTAAYATGTTLPALPAIPVTGIPAELLQRRPDVRRDYLAFEAADRDLAAAISDQYPRLSLSGSLLNVSDQPETLFRDWFVSLGGQLVAPLIDGGQRRAEVARTTAVSRELFNQYGQTMLQAFREVEDGLATERYQRERLGHLQEQLALSRQSATLLREQYVLEPDTDYLAVLTAITGQQRLQREVLSAQLDLRLTRVGLYLALAGGFDLTPQVTNERIVMESTIEISDEPQAEPATPTPDDVTDLRELIADPNLIDSEDQLDLGDLLRATPDG
ncbi:MAG: TolC family protein [Planctomycetota bacterium]